MTKKKTTVKKICWKGSAGIEEAKKLKTELLESFKNNSDICLDISKLEDIDITGIQLILAARKEAEKKKMNFTIADSIPESISSFISAVGIPISSFKSQKANAQEGKNA